MDLYYWKSTQGNFGDDLNLWFWDEIFPGYRETQSNSVLVGVGTILDKELAHEYHSKKKIVFGSGAGYGDFPNIDNTKMWDIYCVRGPLTAKALNLTDDLAITDPCVVMPTLIEQDMRSFRNDVVFVPHWESTIAGYWEEVCRKAGIRYINPCADSKLVISKLIQARLVLAESMHAAIIADAYRIPWVPVTTSSKVNSFKWRDWTKSVETVYEPSAIPQTSPLEATSKGLSLYGLSWSKLKTINGGTTNNNKSPKQLIKNILRSKHISNMLMTGSVLGLTKLKKHPGYLSHDRTHDRNQSRFLNKITQLNAVLKDT